MALHPPLILAVGMGSIYADRRDTGHRLGTGRGSRKGIPAVQDGSVGWDPAGWVPLLPMGLSHGDGFPDHLAEKVGCQKPHSASGTREWWFGEGDTESGSPGNKNI
eukprot:EG_transcript_35669